MLKLARNLGLVKPNENPSRSVAESRVRDAFDLARINEVDFGKFKEEVDKVAGK